MKALNSNNSALDKIHKTLRRNIESYTGEKFAVAGNKPAVPDLRCQYKGFEIHLGRSQADRVLVAIRRAPSTT